MSLILATTWHPRGELARIHKLLPVLKSVYSAIVIVIPPAQMLGDAEPVEIEKLSSISGILIQRAEEWAFGRSIALQTSLHASGDHVHYADLDRLLRWVETRPDEWRSVCGVIQENECVIMGRTPLSYHTHPKALVHTEAISNRVVSYFLDQPMDISAGSKGFSRRAVEYIVANTEPASAMGTDALWVLSLFRAGFPIRYLEVDGLDWESADRYMDRAVTTEDQKRAADEYDKDPENWALRVEVALEIVEAALNAR